MKKKNYWVRIATIELQKANQIFNQEVNNSEYINGKMVFQKNFITILMFIVFGD